MKNKKIFGSLLTLSIFPLLLSNSAAPTYYNEVITDYEDFQILNVEKITDEYEYEDCYSMTIQNLGDGFLTSENYVSISIPLLNNPNFNYSFYIIEGAITPYSKDELIVNCYESSLLDLNSLDLANATTTAFLYKDVSSINATKINLINTYINIEQNYVEFTISPETNVDYAFITFSYSYMLDGKTYRNSTYFCDLFSEPSINERIIRIDASDYEYADISIYAISTYEKTHNNSSNYAFALIICASILIILVPVAFIVLLVLLIVGIVKGNKRKKLKENNNNNNKE